VTGFQVLPTGGTEHESALERDFVTLTSFVDGGAAIVAQPVTIRFDDKGRSRRYTPDFQVTFTDGRIELVEIKYCADLRAGWQHFRPAFAAAGMWARNYGAAFRIATERGIRGQLLDTAKRLLPLRNAPIDSELAQAALAAAATGNCSFAELVAMLPASRSEATGVIWRLIARNSLFVDLSAPIAASSRVSIP
jgi:TnsA endonuclease N terminal